MRENEVGTERKFNEGDGVVHRFGVKGEFLEEAIVTKVHKGGNFKIGSSDSQFRQDGWEVGEEGTWGREWVELLTPETAQKLQRHRLELRTIIAANVFIQSISGVQSHKLEYLSSYLEDVNRKAKGE